MSDIFRTIRDASRAVQDIGRTMRDVRRGVDDAGRIFEVDPYGRDADRAEEQSREQRGLYGRDRGAIDRGILREDIDSGRAPRPVYSDEPLSYNGAGRYQQPREEQGFFGRLFGSDDDDRQPVRAAAERQPAPQRAHRVDRTEIATAVAASNRTPYLFDASRTSDVSQAVAVFLREEGYRGADTSGYWNERNQAALQAWREDSGLSQGNPNRLTNADLARIEQIGEARGAAVAAVAPAVAQAPVRVAAAASTVQSDAEPERPARAPAAAAPAPARPRNPDHVYPGDKGEKVVDVQTKLKALGYDLGEYGPARDGIDGDNGRTTTARIRDFQRDNGLTVDGIVGDNTLAKLNELYTARAAAAAAPEAAPAVAVAPEAPPAAAPPPAPEAPPAAGERAAAVDGYEQNHQEWVEQLAEQNGGIAPTPEQQLEALRGLDLPAGEYMARQRMIRDGATVGDGASLIDPAVGAAARAALSETMRGGMAEAADIASPLAVSALSERTTPHRA